MQPHFTVTFPTESVQGTKKRHSSLLLGSLLLLLLLAGVLHQIWQSRQEAIHSASRMTEAIAELLARRVTGDFGRIDALLGFAAGEFLPDQLASMPPAERAAQSTRLNRLFADFPEVAGAYVFDANGQLQLASDPKTHPYSIADRPHFRAMRDNPRLDAVFANPLVARATGKPAIVQSRAIRDAARRFLGLVNAIYHLESLNTQIEHINVGPGGVTLLRRSDTFTLVARHPRGNESDFDQELAEHNPIRQRIAAGERKGSLQYVATTDDQKRIGSFQVLERHPFYVQVAFSEADYLTEWKQHSFAYLGVFLLLGVPVVIFLLRTDRARVREAAAAEIMARQQERIATSEQRFRDFSTASSDWFWEMDADLRFSFFSEQAENTLGVSPQKLLGRRRDEVANLDDLEQLGKWQAHFKVLEEHQSFRNFEYHVRTEFGGRWYSVSGVPVFDDHNRFCGYRGVGADISARKEAESTLYEATQQLGLMVAASPSGIWRTNDHGANTFVSAQWSVITGISVDAARGPGWASGLHPDDRERIYTEWREIARSDARTYLSHFRFQKPDGKVAWVLCQAVAETGSHGKVVGWIGTITDITAQKELENTLIEARHAADAANIAKSRFLANMSHEIRTPMNGILGMAQMLLMPGITGSERDDYARTILNSGRSLLSLLNDILDYSKVEAGKLQLESIAFDPEQLLRELKTLHLETARSKGLQFEFAWSGEAATYQADAHRVRQMLSNLIGNALKFTSRGEVRVEAAEIERNDKYVVLEFAVSDTGIGIPPDKQALLFKPFSQTDSSTTRQFGGTGLGLSIVRQLAGLMGGDVGVDSQPGWGSRFWFQIRAEVVSPSRRRHQTRIQPAVPPGEQARLNGRLLVVEDDVTNQKVILAMLGSLGLTGLLAGNGQQALDYLAAGEYFDLILMDVQMPVMDGLTATARIRQREREQGEFRRPIIALTADAFAEDRERCFQTGMDDFLTKPIQVAELTGLLQHWLGQTSPSFLPETEITATALPQLSDSSHKTPTFDAAALIDPLGGNLELACMVIDSALGDFPTYFAQLDEACQAGDWKAAERAAHTMKGLSAQVGGKELARQMREADARLKRNEPLDSDTRARLRTEYTTLATALQRWRDANY